MKEFINRLHNAWLILTDDNMYSAVYIATELALATMEQEQKTGTLKLQNRDGSVFQSDWVITPKNDPRKLFNHG